MNTDQATTAEKSMLDEPIEEVQVSFGLVQTKLEGWLEIAVANLPNLVVALLVVIVFGLLSRLVRKVSYRFLDRFSGRQAIARLLATLAGIAVIAIGIFIALGVLQLDKTVTSLLAGAGVIGLALAFAFQDLAANLIAGVYLSFQRPFRIGELIETNGVTGLVDAIDPRTTVIKSTDGRLILIPNKEVFENKLENLSRTGKRRVELEVGVSYAEDLDEVQSVAREAISGVESRDRNREVEIFFRSFGGSSIDFVARFWIPFQRPADIHRATSEAVIAIKKAFDTHGITIPFPIRTLDFGIQGGQPLSQMWADTDSPPMEARSETTESEPKAH